MEENQNLTQPTSTATDGINLEQTTTAPPPNKVKITIITLACLAILALIGVAIGTFMVMARYKTTTPSRQITQPSPTPISTENWKEYMNPSLGFSLKYPSDATIFNELLTATDGRYAGMDIKFSQMNPFTLFSVNVIDYDPELTLSQQIAQFQVSNKREGNKTIASFIKVGSINASKFVTKYSQSEREDIIVFFENENKIYTLTLRFKPSDENQANQLFDQIISTFSFISDYKDLKDFPIYPNVKSMISEERSIQVDNLKEEFTDYKFSVTEDDSFYNVYHWYKDQSQSDWKCFAGAAGTVDDARPSSGMTTTTCRHGNLSFGLSITGDAQSAQVSISVPASAQNNNYISE